MTDSQLWGNRLWGDELFATSEEGGFSHSMKVRAGISTSVRARGLAIDHPLATRNVAIDSRAFSVGYGPAPIHPLRTLPIIETAIEPAHLLFSHSLVTAPLIQVLIEPAHLRFSHFLRTQVLEETDAFGRLGIPHFMGVAPRILSEAEASSLRIGHTLFMAARISSLVTARGITTLHLPTILELLSAADPNGFTAGILNMVPNPSVAISLEGWEPYGGATLRLVEEPVWTGAHSAQLLFIIDGAQGMTIQGAQGLQLEPYGGSILWSGAILATDLSGLLVNVWTRAKYTDGTIVDGEAILAEVVEEGLIGGDWLLVKAPFLSLDETKLLSTAWIVIEPAGPLGSSGRLYVGAAQIEYDLMMYGPGETVAVEAA